MTRKRELALLLVSAALARGARADAPARDDPRARLIGRELDEGSRSPEDRLRILEIARGEALEWSARSASDAVQPVRAGGSAWVNLGPRSANFERNGVIFDKVDSGRTRNVLVHPTNPDVVYLATSGGGVWKTFDATAAIDATNGPHWHPITETLGSLSIGALAMSPINPDSLLLGLGDPFDVRTPGFFHSDDGGATWIGPAVLSGVYPGGTGTLTAASVRDIGYSGDGQVVLAATDVGLFRSVEGGLGSSWQLKDVQLDHDPQEFWSLGRVGGQVWVATSVDLTNQLGRVWPSTDDGASWAQITNFSPLADVTDVRRMTVAVSPSDSASPNSARVYLLAENRDETAQKDVFRSDDGGQSWSALGVNSTRRPVNPNDDQSDLDVMHDQAFYNQMIAVDPQNHDRVLVGGNLCLVRSLDGGSTWAIMAHWLPGTVTVNGAPAAMPPDTYVHADYHAAAISYATSSLVFYAGTDGGIFRSTDVFTAAPGDAHFEDRMNRGIVTHLIYSVFSSGTGLILNASVLDPGSSPATAAATLPTSGPLQNTLVIGVARKKLSTADGDVSFAAGATVFSIGMDMNGTPAEGVIFTGTNLGPKSGGAMLNKAGAEVVSKPDFAIGILAVSL